MKKRFDISKLYVIVEDGDDSLEVVSNVVFTDKGDAEKERKAMVVRHVRYNYHMLVTDDDDEMFRVACLDEVII